MSITKFVVNRWNDKPVKKEYSRETENFYMHLKGRGRDAKISRWETYFDSEDEAIAFISSRNGAIERNKEIDRIKLHAVPLLEALEGLLHAYEDPGNTGSAHDDKVEAARSAIARARARGEA